MKRNSKASIRDKVAKQIEAMEASKPIPKDTRTGREQMRSILAPEIVTLSIKAEPEPQIVLYLREGVNPAEKNFTKYPNDIHAVMKKLLTEKRPKGPKQSLVEVTETAEGNLYMYLWWLSWGYGKNYCRVSHGKMSRDSLVGSRRNAQRAVDTLAEKHFIVRALQENGEANVDQNGHLYRIITPEELRNGKTSEGVELNAIPAEGVVMVTTDTVTIPLNQYDNSDSEGMDATTIRQDDYSHPGYGQGGYGRDGYTSIDRTAIDTVTTPPVKPDDDKAGSRYGQDDHSQGVTPLKEDSLKDSLSPDLIELFYTGIGQKRISKVKREKGDSVLKELQKEGFSPGDIQFTIEWTLRPGNTKEKVHDFSILSHTIGAALAAKEATQQAAESARKEAARVSAAEEEQRRLEGEIEKKLSEMDPDQLADLESQARQEMSGVNASFITEMSVRGKMKEILGRS